MADRRTISARAALANSRGALSVLELSVGLALVGLAFIVLAIFTYEAGGEGYQSMLRSIILAITGMAAVTGICSAVSRAGQKSSACGRVPR